MSNMNHGRPHLKIVDCLKRELAVLDATYVSKESAGNRRPEKIEFRERVITAADRKTHALACKILTDVKLCNEIRNWDKLVNSLVGARKKAMIKWFCEFGRVTTVRPRGSKEPMEAGRMLYFIRHCKSRPNDAELHPFWEYMPPVKVRSPQ